MQPQQAPVTKGTTPAPLASGVEFRKGVLYGRVLDVAGKPVPDATIALQDKNGKVLAWAKSNAQGEYAIAADPLTALHLRPSRRRGLLEQVVRAAGDVVMAPVKVVGSAVANPGKTAKAAAVSIATGTPAPLAVEAVAPVLGNKNAVEETAKQARETAAKTAVGDGPARAQTKSAVQKGEAQILVSAPSFKDARGEAKAYWLERACTDKTNSLGTQAWLETIKMAPATGGKPSEIAQEALTLADPVVEPTLVPCGETVKITAKLLSPLGLDNKVRVFAREARKHTVVELLPQQGTDQATYSATMIIDPNTPAGETTLTLSALRADPIEVKLDKRKADPLINFVRRLDDMEPSKVYEYDPRIMASENRLDVKLTVLDTKKGTPTLTTLPPAPGGKKG